MGKTKVERLGMAEQVEQWLQEGEDYRTIASWFERDTGEPISHAAVGNFARKIKGEAFHTLSKTGRLRVRTVEEALSYLDDVMEFLDTADGLEKEQKALLSEKREWFDRIMKIQGLYAPDTAVQVGVQVNQVNEKEFWDKIRHRRDP